MSFWDKSKAPNKPLFTFPSHIVDISMNKPYLSEVVEAEVIPYVDLAGVSLVGCEVYEVLSVEAIPYLISVMQDATDKKPSDFFFRLVDDPTLYGVIPLTHGAGVRYVFRVHSADHVKVHLNCAQIMTAEMTPTR